MRDLDLKEKLEKNRLKEMDIFKAIAIVSVVYGHVLANTAGLYTGFISFVHMPVFYFVSGFFLYKELKKYSEKELIKKKSRRLMVPYFVWSLVAFMASNALIVLQKGFDIGVVLDEAVQVFIYSRSVWFFIQLFFAHSLFILIHRITDKKELRAVINVGVWAVLIVFCDTELFCMWKIKWLYGFLLLGYICSEYEILTRLKSCKKFVPVVMFIICAACWIAATLLTSGAYATDLIYGFDDMAFSAEIFAVELSVWLCGLTGMVTIYLVSLFIAEVSKLDILYRLGSYTLDLYVAHMMIISFIKMIPVPQNHAFEVSFVIAVFVIIVPIYLLVKYILRKIKLYRMVT